MQLSILLIMEIRFTLLKTKLMILKEIYQVSSQKSKQLRLKFKGIKVSLRILETDHQSEIL